MSYKISYPAAAGPPKVTQHCSAFLSSRFGIPCAAAEPDPACSNVALTLPSGESFHSTDINVARCLAREASAVAAEGGLYGTDALTASAVDSWIDFSRDKIGSSLPPSGDVLSRLNAHLSERTFLVGHALTIADITAFTALGGPPSPTFLEPFPHVLRWWENICVELLGQSAAPAVRDPTAAAANPVSGVGGEVGNGNGNGNGNGGGEVGASTNFIKQIVAADIEKGVHKEVVTRFPPEPNGFLHIGHAKSICLNFGLPQAFGGRCHLRFDDTNPTKEEQRYIDAIEEDVRWLGFDWGEHLYHASDYFEQLFEWAVLLIKRGYAYVDDSTNEEMRAMRGDITKPGQDSPYRNRSVEENLDLFMRMKAGEFDEGKCVLRAKIDMASGNMNMRDPAIYRILKQSHPRTGDKWCVYPMYDFAHGQSDSVEKITHSICTLEFELHRPLYDWLQEKLDIFRVRQIEFARLNMTYMMTSKRKLLALVQEGRVSGWDDPRMSTLSGVRRRGYPPAAIRNFCEKIGVAKRDNLIHIEQLENCVREEMHVTCERRNAVLVPLKLVITNFPEGLVEEVDAPNHPEDPDTGTRKLSFARELYIERDDFMEQPSARFFRLAPGREVRLKCAYWIKATDVIKDGNTGEIVAVHCTYDPQTKGGEAPPDGRKVKGTLHWVSAHDAKKAEFRLYDRLFAKPDPEEDVPEGGDWRDNLNPESLKVVHGLTEPSLATAKPGDAFQFERVGFFAADPDTATAGMPVFNRTVTLLADKGMTDEVDPVKEARRLAQEKAAAERQRVKEERERKKAEKERKKALAGAAANGSRAADSSGPVNGANGLAGGG
ncbi:unnamed protein product [Vitrella brassicaformis CCMP3155]|uniref:glutamine--tRNA ligase n=2 Tax=Vitrella brassicaformis TaxID=1169539 RepID=A0A0G4EHG5_VITBC|nr:unnamed protein product [Vitrella brassicaformis CCMP3155]|eukprot:CEL95338.1 unnamed protein product [Vitrella brassicaformis CCMP3155]